MIIYGTRGKTIKNAVAYEWNVDTVELMIKEFEDN